MHSALPQPTLFLLAFLALAACGPRYSPDTYATRAVQQANKVEQGTVVGRRPVRVSAEGTAGAATGAAALVFSVACNSFVQLGVEAHVRGRILALYFMCFLGGTPVGAPLIGWVSERLGARWGFIAGGLVCIVVAAAAGAVLARGRRVRLELHLAPPAARLHVDERS